MKAFANWKRRWNWRRRPDAAARRRRICGDKVLPNLVLLAREQERYEPRMSVYADTSLLISYYINDSNSVSAQAILHRATNEWDHPRKADVVSKVIGDFRGINDLATYAKAFPRFLDALNRPQAASKPG